MVAVVVGMLFCVGLGVAVMALVAVPARRQGRDVLTERGEEVVLSLRERADVLGRSGDGAPAALEEPVGARG
jgi:hypothetical protein